MAVQLPQSGLIGEGFDEWLEGLRSDPPCDYLSTPWPDLDRVADLQHIHRVTFVAQRGQHEATIGRRLAAHVAEELPVLLFSSFPPSSQPPKLVIDETSALTPERVEQQVEAMRRSGNAPALVVIERFERMKLDLHSEDWTRTQELEEVGNRLRWSSAERACPLILTTVTDEPPRLDQRVAMWAGIDSPASILTDYSNRLIVLRRRDDNTVEAVVECDDFADPNRVEQLEWERPAGARPILVGAAPKPAPVALARKMAVSHPAPADASGVQAIETEYAGHLFRSRLEARWAVFMDALGITWEYEPQRYQLPSGKYLPDFWLPAQQFYLEVKGTPPSSYYRRLLQELADGTGARLMLAVGSIPDARTYKVEAEGADFWMAEFSPGSTDDESGTDFAGWTKCPACGAVDVVYGLLRRFTYCACKAAPLAGSDEPVRAVLDALRAARSARFEHGESGAML